MIKFTKMAFAFMIAASAASSAVAGGPVQNSKPTPSKGQAFICALSAKKVMYSNVGPAGGPITAAEKSTWHIISVASESLLAEIALNEGKAANDYRTQVDAERELATRGGNTVFLKEETSAAQILFTQLCVQLFGPGMP